MKAATTVPLKGASALREPYARMVEGVDKSAGEQIVGYHHADLACARVVRDRVGRNVSGVSAATVCVVGSTRVVAPGDQRVMAAVPRRQR